MPNVWIEWCFWYVSLPFGFVENGDFLPGKHNCLWCLITSSELKIPLDVRGRKVTRSLDTLWSDNRRFQEAGGNITKAKLFNNVIGEPILDIPLDNVRCFW